MNERVPSLFDKDPYWLNAPATPLERKFADFHRRNPQVYDEIERRAMALVTAGRTRIGIAELVEDLRYEPKLRTELAAGADKFKLNNNYRAFYARLFIYHHTGLTGVIETRRQPSRNRVTK